MRDYAYVLGITLVALFVAAAALLYLYTNFKSGGGLESDEISVMAILFLSIATQVSVYLTSRQNKEISKDTNVNTPSRVRGMVEEESEAANTRQDERWKKDNGNGDKH